ncbi:MAG: PLP-dependent aminotransferase family protein [Lachnospiraceae bacterium]|nr:PLP-dependent aminotransferase family protein [Lachnospiraceae bacterium]
MLTYPMEDRGNESKTDYLVRRIKEDILSFELKANDRMPSKRQLAEHLGISKITVERAYEILVAEDYLYAKERSGYFVRDIEQIRPGIRELRGIPSVEPGSREEYMKMISDERMLELYRDSSTFRQLQRIVRKVLSERPQALGLRAPAQGLPEFRRAIAGHLRRFRGMDVQADQVVVGAGSEYLYGQILVLMGHDSIYAVEDPCYEKILLMYERLGAQVERLPLGPDGILSEALQGSHANVLHVSPFNSYPSNTVTSLAKRHEYMEWARERGAWLVEDDFDSEFNYLRQPTPPMFARDNGERVIYMNTFTKTVASSVRAAYMVLPRKLLPKYRELMGDLTCPVSILGQLILSEFLDSGQFEKHLTRMRRNAEKYR